ncbi:MAG: alpha/beta hydrolase [Acidimicrobiia bacterium]|nr:alpha/beta hydrolase [Acidimicrobiia bacterium]
MSVGNADVAYQIVGEGPPDLLLFEGLSHSEMQWTYDPSAEYRWQLASVTRLISFDPRGMGASERVPMTDLATWEEWTDDISAVLDATESEQTAIFAATDGGPAAILFAAMHPERVTNLIVMNTSARFSLADDYPIGVAPGTIAGLVDFFRTAWGTPELARAIAGETDDDEYVRFVSQWLRATATPKGAAEHFRYVFEELDVRQALPLVQAPTLILHNRGNGVIPISHAEYLRDHIAGARLVELPFDGVGVPPQERHHVVDEVIEFVTGTCPPTHLDPGTDDGSLH